MQSAAFCHSPRSEGKCTLEPRCLKGCREPTGLAESWMSWGQQHTQEWGWLAMGSHRVSHQIDSKGTKISHLQAAGFACRTHV